MILLINGDILKVYTVLKVIALSLYYFYIHFTKISELKNDVLIQVNFCDEALEENFLLTQFFVKDQIIIVLKN